MAQKESIEAIRELFVEMPTHSKGISTIERKILKQKLKKLKNESRNRGRGRSKQKIYETPVPIPEKIKKIEG